MAKDQLMTVFTLLASGSAQRTSLVRVSAYRQPQLYAKCPVCLGAYEGIITSGFIDSARPYTRVFTGTSTV